MSDDVRAIMAVVSEVLKTSEELTYPIEKDSDLTNSDARDYFRGNYGRGFTQGEREKRKKIEHSLFGTHKLTWHDSSWLETFFKIEPPIQSDDIVRAVIDSPIKKVLVACRMFLETPGERQLKKK